MNIKTLCIALALSISFIYPAFADEKGPYWRDVEQIYHEFIIANATAEKCLKPDEYVLRKNLENFIIVQARVIDKFIEDEPEASKSEISFKIKTIISTLKNATEYSIDELGCDHEKIRKVIDLFYMQSELEFPYE